MLPTPGESRHLRSCHPVPRSFSMAPQASGKMRATDGTLPPRAGVRRRRTDPRGACSSWRWRSTSTPPAVRTSRLPAGCARAHRAGRPGLGRRRSQPARLRTGFTELDYQIDRPGDPEDRLAEHVRREARSSGCSSSGPAIEPTAPPSRAVSRDPELVGVSMGPGGRHRSRRARRRPSTAHRLLRKPGMGGGPGTAAGLRGCPGLHLEALAQRLR